MHITKVVNYRFQNAILPCFSFKIFFIYFTSTLSRQNKIAINALFFSVFDDGDENTLRRTQLCLKGEKHFVKSEVRIL